MAEGARENREHQAAVQLLGKGVSKRAGFRCEWCDGNEELRLWEYRPDEEPAEENLALLCRTCRELNDARNPDPRRLFSVKHALWSQVPAVAEGAALLLARCREPWAREAIEESLIDPSLKEKLLQGKS